MLLLGTPENRAAAGFVVAATNMLLVADAEVDVVSEALMPDGRLVTADGVAVDAFDVVQAAGVIVSKLIVDVREVLGVDIAETVSRLGLWVARDDVREDASGG